jgi:predicted nucleotide-binding protein (sugar kinase/HSP70/actin superfamily)
LEDYNLKVGYPRALLYYKYFPLWETFLTRLGVEVVPSGATNKSILTRGTVEAENELCLPVKVFYGHLLELSTEVDAIFVPRIVSVEKSAYTCPKFLGLPDMARSVDGELPPIIGPTIDRRLGWRAYLKTVLEFGRQFSDNPAKILAAYWAGLRALRDYRHRLGQGLVPTDAIEGREAPVVVKGDLKIGIAGHPYNIYDEYISMNLINRIQRMGATVATSEMLPEDTIARACATLPKKLFWTYEREVVGTVFHWARTEAVDGIIYVLAFPCGPDSLIQSLMEHELRREGLSVPMMSLVIDEHSGEAGFMTRIEAFLDMLSRRKKLAARAAG